jgi:hypothetical protein
MNQVLNAEAGAQSEMVFLPEGEHACNGPAAPLVLFIGKRGHPTGGRFESPFDDFLGRAAHAAGERGFQELLAVR